MVGAEVLQLNRADFSIDPFQHILVADGGFHLQAVALLQLHHISGVLLKGGLFNEFEVSRRCRESEAAYAARNPHKKAR